MIILNIRILQITYTRGLVCTLTLNQIFTIIISHNTQTHRVIPRCLSKAYWEILPSGHAKRRQAGDSFMLHNFPRAGIAELIWFELVSVIIWKREELISDQMLGQHVRSVNCEIIKRGHVCGKISLYEFFCS